MFLTFCFSPWPGHSRRTLGRCRSWPWAPCGAGSCGWRRFWASCPDASAVGSGLKSRRERRLEYEKAYWDTLRQRISPVSEWGTSELKVKISKEAFHCLLPKKSLMWKNRRWKNGRMAMEVFFCIYLSVLNTSFTKKISDKVKTDKKSSYIMMMTFLIILTGLLMFKNLDVPGSSLLPNRRFLRIRGVVTEQLGAKFENFIFLFFTWEST